MPKWDAASQGESGWLKARQGKLTASRMADALDFTKKGESAKRYQLKVDLVAERLADAGVSHFTTPAMRHGSFWEQYAREAYMLKTGEVVQECGFAEHSTIDFFGASPDGLVNPDGLIEIKCPTLSTFTRWLIAGDMPTDYIPQMLAQLAVTGRKWVDFVAFFPCDDDVARISEEETKFFGQITMPKSHQIKIWRFTPTPEEITAVEDAARTFLAEVDYMFDKIVLGG